MAEKHEQSLPAPDGGWPYGHAVQPHRVSRKSPFAFDLTPDGGAVIGDTARIAPAIPFHRAKGRLPLPAAGTIETHFGEPIKFGGRSKGRSPPSSFCRRGL